MKATFENSVNILVKAYMNDTLKHRECSACAVGNIIRYNRPEVFTGKAVDDTMWLRLISMKHRGERHNYIDFDIAERQVEASGYTVYELHRIEEAFEQCPYGETEDKWMFNGLMAVLDVLADIHGIDIEVKESAKLLFVKA